MFSSHSPAPIWWQQPTPDARLRTLLHKIEEQGPLPAKHHTPPTTRAHAARNR